jgi:hypothetical protein
VNVVGQVSCHQCRFCGTKVAPGSNILAYVCRFNPPTTHAVMVQTREGPAWQVACILPEVTRDDWCSKFEPQEH